MILVTTGMDNTGKTTLTDSLERLIPGISRVRSLGPVSGEEQVKFMVEVIGRGTDEGLILCERFPALDEEVYGPILRSGSNFPMDTHNGDVWKILKEQLIIIYTRTSHQNIFNFGDREQYPGVKEKSLQLLTAWDSLYFRLFHKGFNIIPYDYEYNTPEQLLEMLQPYITKGGK